MKALQTAAIPCAALIGLVAFAGTVDGQTIPSNFKRIEFSQEAGPFVDVFSGGTGRFGFGPKDGTVFGGRYAVEIGGPFSFEGVAGFMLGTRDVIDPELAEGSRVAGESDVEMLLAEARFKFAFMGRRGWHGLAPHILFGAGVGHDFAGLQPADERILESDRFDFGTTFLMTGGAGTRWFVTDKWTVRAEGVVRIWQLQTPPGYGEANRGFDNVEESEWTNNFSLSFGLAYRF